MSTISEPPQNRGWVFVTEDNVEHVERPRNGEPYKVKILDQAAYDAAVQDGSFYAGLGGPITDIRRTTS